MKKLRSSRPCRLGVNEGTAFSRGSRLRRYATMACTSSSDMPLKISDGMTIRKRPSLPMPSRMARMTSPSVHPPMPVSMAGVMFGV